MALLSNKELLRRVPIFASLTEAQLEILQELGCNLGQGYHFSRSVPADQLGELMRGEREA